MLFILRFDNRYHQLHVGCKTTEMKLLQNYKTKWVEHPNVSNSLQVASPWQIDHPSLMPTIIIQLDTYSSRKKKLHQEGGEKGPI